MLNTLRALRAKWPNAKQVFVNAEGKPLIDSGIRKAWRSACKAAGVPDLLFHDLRRSAVRNLRRASVTESVAMKFSGHKTASVFRRYDITDFDDLKDAASRLKKLLCTQTLYNPNRPVAHEAVLFCLGPLPVVARSPNLVSSEQESVPRLPAHEAKTDPPLRVWRRNLNPEESYG